VARCLLRRELSPQRGLPQAWSAVEGSGAAYLCISSRTHSVFPLWSGQAHN